jgi:hypothetical protein
MSMVGCGVGVGQPISDGPGMMGDAATEASDDLLARDLVAYWTLDEQGVRDEVLDSSQWALAPSEIVELYYR